MVESAWAVVVAAAAAGWLVEGVEAGGWLVEGGVEEGAGCAMLLVAAPSGSTADDAGLAALRLSPALVDDT